MAGTINSLGIGSGVLTADVIDKLKANEKSVTLDPIKKKITFNEQQKQALDLLSSLMTTFQSSVSSLADDTMFSARTVSGSNDGIKVTAENGVAEQSFSITDVMIATSSVQQSGSFASRDSTFATNSGSLNLAIDGANYTIDYTASMTLNDLKDKINEVAGDVVTASILQTGDNAYSLVLKSNNTGTNQDITVTDNSGNVDSKLINKTYKSDSFAAITDSIASSSGSMTITVGSSTSTINYTAGMTLNELKNAINNDSTLQNVAVANIVEESPGNFKLVINPIGTEDGTTVSITDNNSGLDTKLTTSATNTNGIMNEVMQAKDATFKYNGISMTRSSNTIEDIIVGVKIELNSSGSSANIKIEQDLTPVADEMQNLVNSYNAMIKELDKMVTADPDKGTRGVFFGDSNIRNLGREITKLITGTDANGNSLAQYGISLNQDGTMTFSKSDFDAKVAEDPKKAQEFFAGTTTNSDSGIFDQLKEKLKSYTSFNNGVFTILKQGIDSEHKNLQTNYEKSLALLNARYDSMTQRFIEYDAIISKLNNQFAVLQQQIQMAINSKS